MKAITIMQPWASLVALGAKRIETRTWQTTYRGPIAIHASKGFPEESRLFASREPASGIVVTAGVGVDELPLGAIVAVARLSGVARAEDFLAMSQGLQRHEITFGDYSRGRYGWVMQDVWRLPEPVPCRGSLGIWTLPLDVACGVTAQEQFRPLAPVAPILHVE